MADLFKSLFVSVMLIAITSQSLVRAEAGTLSSARTLSNIVSSESTLESDPSSYYRGQRQTGYGNSDYYQQPYYNNYNQGYQYQKPYYNNYNQGWNTGFGYNNRWGNTGYQGGNYYNQYQYQRPYYNNYYSGGGGGYGGGVGIFPQPVREGYL